MSAADVFSDVYAADRWNGGSGPGSAPENSEEYRRFLSGHLDELRATPGVARVVDLGCGDWRIGELLDWTGLDYVGIDVVPEVIAANLRRDTPDNVTFVCLDALTAPLPPGDLLIVKDVFQHWPTADIARFLDKYADGLYPEGVIVTNDVSARRHPARLNSDIEMGDWRPVDVESAPFNRRARDWIEYPVLDEWVKRAAVIR